jgi:hypothetical protein
VPAVLLTSTVSFSNTRQHLPNNKITS